MEPKEGTIVPVAVAERRYASQWGVTINDYQVVTGGVETRSDFEMLLVDISTRRAAKIENEISPLEKKVQNRNKIIKSLSDCLSDLNAMENSFKQDDEGTVESSTRNTGMTDANYTFFRNMFSGSMDLSNVKKQNDGKWSFRKSDVAKASQLVKSMVDKLNNDAQLDMTRLQSLVSKRDESFTTASSLMSAISDTRSNAIKGMT